MSTSLYIILIICGGLFAVKIIYAISVVIALPFSQGAFYVSTSRKRISTILDTLPMTHGQRLIDLGCGDGRVLRMANKKYGVQAIGYEVNLLAYFKAKLLCIKFKDIHIRFSNFYKADLSKADIIFCYLYPDAMKSLSKKLKSDFISEIQIVSCNFELPGFTPEKMIRPKGSLHNDPIYFYLIKKPSSCKKKLCKQ